MGVEHASSSGESRPRETAGGESTTDPEPSLRTLRVVLCATLVGGLTGLVSAAFHALLNHASDGREALRTALESQPVPGWIITAAITAVLAAAAVWMVARIAPEASGSGIHEVEGILASVRALRWRRVLPVKFFGGLLSIGSGMVMGREGPTIHMGSALGGLIAERFRLRPDRARTLVAAGAGAGLAAAFNAPLAGIIFVTEEMRSEFNYTFTSLQSVIAASCMAVVVNDWWLGQGFFMPVDNVPLAPLIESPLFLLLGILIGVMGVGFNTCLLWTVQRMGEIRRRHAILLGLAVGAVIGALGWFVPDAIGGGEALVERLLAERLTLAFLLGLLVLRFVTTMGSYGSGAPGGVFAPMLALGTISGVAFGHLAQRVAPGIESTPGMFAVAAMGALFAATVRAPLTGIVLVVELTGAHEALLTIILTCLSSTLTAQALGGRPIYSQLLQVAVRTAPLPPSETDPLGAPRG